MNRERRTIVILRLLSCALALGVLSTGISQAADIPKEGSFAYDLFVNNVVKVVPMSKEHSVVSFTGLNIIEGGGVFDHSTASCTGLEDFWVGRPSTGNILCIGVDPDGDKTFWVGPTQELFPSSTRYSFNLTDGTGKYTGISGTSTCDDLFHQYR